MYEKADNSFHLRLLGRISEKYLDCLIIVQYKYIYKTIKRGCNTKGNTEDKKPASPAQIAALCKNYEKMNETGKRKLHEVSEKILDIWNAVNKEGT